MKKYLKEFLKTHPEISSDFHEWNDYEFKLFCKYIMRKRAVDFCHHCNDFDYSCYPPRKKSFKLKWEILYDDIIWSKILQ